jgi:hypothetical protein
MMTVNQKNIKPGQQDDFLRIQDLLYLCLARWKWFVLSLAVTIGAATAYLLRTPAVELPTSLDDEFIQKVTELVKEGLGKNFNVDTLCASVNMSRTSFYNKIKALTGIAPAEFIRKIFGVGKAHFV